MLLLLDAVWYNKRVFGYLRPVEDKLTQEQKKIYKSYYCGVCKSMGRRYSAGTRFALTYDCAFLALLLDSICDNEADFTSSYCGVKSVDVASGNAVDFGADVNVLLAFQKLEDDVKDSGSNKARLYKAVLKSSYEKAKIANQALNELIISNLDYLSLLESEKCSEPEIVAESFGRLLEGVFGFGSDKNPNLMGFGLWLGKYIYLLDAFLDFEKDIKNGEYNVFYLAYGKTDDLKKKISFTIESVLSKMNEYYNKLNIKRNKEILDNIIYMGMLSELLKEKKGA